MSCLPKSQELIMLYLERKSELQKRNDYFFLFELFIVWHKKHNLIRTCWASLEVDCVKPDWPTPDPVILLFSPGI